MRHITPEINLNFVNTRIRSLVFVCMCVLTSAEGTCAPILCYSVAISATLQPTKQPNSRTTNQPATTMYPTTEK